VKAGNQRGEVLDGRVYFALGYTVPVVGNVRLRLFLFLADYISLWIARVLVVDESVLQGD
jgi:hypothetical protein